MRRILFLLCVYVLVVLASGFGGSLSAQSGPAPVPTWSDSFNYNGQWDYTMIGADPSNGGTTTVPVYLVPVSINIGGTVYGPSTTIVASVLASPLLCQPSGSNQCTIPFYSGGNDFGVTQYLDAFQRANVWAYDSSNNYHLLLGAPAKIIVPTVTPPSGDSGIFSSGEGWVNNGWWETTYLPQTLAQLQQSKQITQNGLGLTIFLVYDICGTDGPNGGCFHHGNHFDTVFGSTPEVQYSLWADYNDLSSYIFTDVAVLSHEVGEWADDPYKSNSVYCDGGFMEVGDPLAGMASSYVKYGSWHLQDLVFLTYFGDSGVSINNQFSFQNNQNLSICSNGP